jgi:DHA1 family tetracycline resistance protein-like MFS transporter
MPSIFAYIEKHGGDDFFFASVLFIYSLGELVGALAFGYMHNLASTTLTLYVSVGCGFFGSALYALADYVGGGSALWMIFLARTLQGLWTGGQQSLEQAYVSEVVDKEDNLKVNAEIGMAAVSGFIFGPVIGLALSFINIKIGSVAVDSFTAPGYIQLLATALMLS